MNGAVISSNSAPVATEDTSARIYIGRLHKDANEKQVDALCSEFGRVRHVNIKTGFAFVDFESVLVARDAAERLNNRVFLNSPIVVEIAKGRPKFDGKDSSERSGFHPFPRTNHRLIAEGLHSSISWQTLKDHMRRASQVIYCEVVNGNGIIEFASFSDMISALRKLDQTDILGHRIFLREDLPPRGSSADGYRREEPRYASPPPTRGRHRSYSRSPPPMLRYSRSPPPPMRVRYSRSPSPPPRRRYSRSPPPTRRYSRSPVRPIMRRYSSRSPPPTSVRRYSRSPPPFRRFSRSPPPPLRRYSRSPPPRRYSRSRSPPPHHHYRR